MKFNTKFSNSFSKIRLGGGRKTPKSFEKRSDWSNKLADYMVSIPKELSIKKPHVKISISLEAQRALLFKEIDKSDKDLEKKVYNNVLKAEFERQKKNITIKRLEELYNQLSDLEKEITKNVVHKLDGGKK